MSEVSKTFRVSNQQELESALEQSTGGETILLESGNYGSLDLRGMNFTSEVTIKSADPKDFAVIENVYMKDSSNISFDSLDFDFKTENGAHTNFYVWSSTGISVSNSNFDGDTEKDVDSDLFGGPAGVAFKAFQSADITFENNKVESYQSGPTIIYSDDVSITNNELVGLRTDGIVVVASNGVLMEANHIHSFRSVAGSGEHIDSIQLFSSQQTEPSTDITIRGNFIDRGDGNFTQSIFIRNEAVDAGGAGEEMFYRNILIEDNIIFNAHSHGITVGETDGLTIRNNTVLFSEGADGSSFSEPSIRVSDGATNVVIEDNIADRVTANEEGGHQVSGNILVQHNDPAADNYIGDLFVNALADADASVNDLRLVPNSDAANSGAGAPQEVFDRYADGPLEGYISNSAGVGFNLQTLSFNVESLVDQEPVNIVWSFGNGQTANGTSTVVTYPSAGEYKVSANLTFADGSTTVIEQTVVVEGVIAADVRFDGDNFATSSDTSVGDVTMPDSATFEAGNTGNAVRFDGEYGRVKFNDAFANNTEYSVFVDFKPDDGSTSNGTIFALPGSFSVNAVGDELIVTVTTDVGGQQRIVIGDLPVNDGNWHQFGITFSSENGEANIYLDGKQIALIDELDGAVQIGRQSTDLFLGGAPGSNTFAGVLDNLIFVRGYLEATDVQSRYESFQNGTIDPILPISEGESEQEAEEQEEDASDTTEPNTDEDNGGNETETDGDTEVVDDVVVTMSLTSSDDRYYGNGSDTEVHGGDGDDVLTNMDLAYGGSGDDIISGTNDQGDILFGGIGNDSVNGRFGNDELHGDAGHDSLRGGVGDDTLFGGDGDDALQGEVGNDRLMGEAGDDRLLGEYGDDYVDGGDGDDLVAGGDGNDVLLGGSGADKILGGNGDDILVAGTEDVLIDGGAGYDIVRVENDGAGMLDLSDLSARFFEQFDFSNGNADNVTLDYRDASKASGGLFITGDEDDTVFFENEVGLVGQIEKDGVDYDHFVISRGSVDYDVFLESSIETVRSDEWSENFDLFL